MKPPTRLKNLLCVQTKPIRTYQTITHGKAPHQEHANEEQPECGEQREKESVQAGPLPFKPARVQA